MGRTIIDRYRVVELIGSGGMGEAYRAEDLCVGGYVVLKSGGDKLSVVEGSKWQCSAHLGSEQMAR